MDYFCYNAENLINIPSSELPVPTIFQNIEIQNQYSYKHMFGNCNNLTGCISTDGTIVSSLISSDFNLLNKQILNELSSVIYVNFQSFPKILLLDFQGFLTQHINR